MSNETKPPTRPLSEFKADLYLNLSPGELVVFAIQVLQSDDLPITTEEIVSICFRLFPQSFSLRNYFYWPDSALVVRRLHDVREKGYVKGNPAEGFALKVKGRQVAKRVAKALGVTLPEPKKVGVEQTLPTPPVADSAPEASKTPEAKLPEPEVKPAPVARKKKTAPPQKPAGKKRKSKTVQPALKKPMKSTKKLAAPILKKEAKQTPARLVENKTAVPKKVVAQPKLQDAPPTQLALSMPVATPVQKKAEGKKPKAPARKEAQKPIPQSPVSKEEKDKAGKVIKMMERSDAFKHYGRKAPISEFDFRNMLFATMESSAETLKRNVELYKRYAGLHNRTDLINFLDFCEDRFALLLTAPAKPAKRLKL